jgi:hypothetical protein
VLDLCLQADAAARDAALTLFQTQLLSRRQGSSLKESLIAGMDKEYKARETANIAESNTLCQDLEMKCEQLLDRLGVMQVPSMRRFELNYQECHAQFEVSLHASGSWSFLQLTVYFE